MRVEKMWMTLETIEQSQHDAYEKGLLLQQQHFEQQRVVDDEMLLILTADFGQVSLFKFQQEAYVFDAHERAGVCANAFQEGYKAGRKTTRI